jgi:hypothetical protein
MGSLGSDGSEGRLFSRQSTAKLTDASSLLRQQGSLSFSSAFVAPPLLQCRLARIPRLIRRGCLLRNIASSSFTNPVDS